MFAVISRKPAQVVCAVLGTAALVLGALSLGRGHDWPAAVAMVFGGMSIAGALSNVSRPLAIANWLAIAALVGVVGILTFSPSTPDQFATGVLVAVVLAALSLSLLTVRSILAVPDHDATERTGLRKALADAETTLNVAAMAFEQLERWGSDGETPDRRAVARMIEGRAAQMAEARDEVSAALAGTATAGTGPLPVRNGVQ